MATRTSRVIVIGLDGFEPRIVEEMLRRRELPHLAGLLASGGYARVATTYSAQTPVAWSTFATGTNPGGHGIFDFVHRDPATYRLTLSLNRYEQKNIFTPPRAVNMRRGVPVWDLLTQAGVPSVILRCPCTYPPDALQGRMLAGVGVPDLRGGLGTTTFYTTRPDASPGESENVVSLPTSSAGGIRTHLIGPRNPRTREDIVTEITLEPDSDARLLRIRSDGQPAVLEVQAGRWSDWLHIRFRTGPLMSARGMVRFYLSRLEPALELHASPLNFDPDAPLFPISAPPEYARDLATAIGAYYTTGMVEDHTGLNNGRISEQAYLEQCGLAMREREAMMLYELARFKDGLFYCLFDTPDRLQHMFWRYREPNHPANAAAADSGAGFAIAEHYRACDAIVGRALAYADERTLFVVLSDHGMNSFQRGLHLNSWLHAQGFLAFQKGIAPGEGAGDFFAGVDWTRTRAYALGLGAIYLNLRGREGAGIVAPEDAPEVKAAIVRGLTGLRDPARAEVAVRSVVPREQVYAGLYAGESPDLLVNCAPGYRVSWGTPLGGAPAGLFEDNTRRWSGDHAIDPLLVPGVLFMNRPFASDAPTLLDLAPTILAALGVPAGAAMEGHALR